MKIVAGEGFKKNETECRSLVRAAEGWSGLGGGGPVRAKGSPPTKKKTPPLLCGVPGCSVPAPRQCHIVRVCVKASPAVTRTRSWPPLRFSGRCSAEQVLGFGVSGFLRFLMFFEFFLSAQQDHRGRQCPRSHQSRIPCETPFKALEGAEGVKTGATWRFPDSAPRQNCSGVPWFCLDSAQLWRSWFVSRHAAPSRWGGRCRAQDRRVHSGNQVGSLSHEQAHRRIESQLGDAERRYGRERGSTCS